MLIPLYQTSCALQISRQQRSESADHPLLSHHETMLRDLMMSASFAYEEMPLDVSASRAKHYCAFFRFRLEIIDRQAWIHFSQYDSAASFEMTMTLAMSLEKLSISSRGNESIRRGIQQSPTMVPSNQAMLPSQPYH